MVGFRVYTGHSELYLCMFLQTRLYALNQVRELLSAEKDKGSSDEDDGQAKTLTTLNYSAHLLILAGSFSLGVNTRETGTSKVQPTHYTVSTVWLF